MRYNEFPQELNSQIVATVATAFSIEQLIALNDEIVSLVRGGVPLELGLRELGGDSAGALQKISQSLAARMNAGASLTRLCMLKDGDCRPPTGLSSKRAFAPAGCRRRWKRFRITPAN